MLARVDPTLDCPVILFQDVIEILHRGVLAVVCQIACGLEHGNGGRISSVLVGVDDPRRGMVLPAQGLVCSAVVVAWPWWLAIAMHSCGIRVFRRPSFDPAALRL